VADIVGKEARLEVEELVERGCFLQVCRRLVMLGLEVVVEERDETKKLNDHEASIKYHNSEQLLCTCELVLFELFVVHVLSF
jgi:hypothetical protein